MTQLQHSPTVYQGQFGEFTITQSDRTGTIIYRTGLMVAALSFALGSWLVLVSGDNPSAICASQQRFAIAALTPLYACFCLGLGISLVTIHIYLAALHRILQVFWLIGVVTALVLAVQSSQPLALTAYNSPAALFGISFTFAALTGIYFKEAFCFNRLETKLLTPLVPILLLGHLTKILPLQLEEVLLGLWAVLFFVFALRKTFQAIPPDIGDKSVFTYLKEHRLSAEAQKRTSTP